MGCQYARPNNIDDDDPFQSREESQGEVVLARRNPSDFGFSTNVSANPERNLSILKKWLKFNGDMIDFTSAYQNDERYFRSQIALKGVPSQIRWSVWRIVAGCAQIFRPGLYSELKHTVLQNVQWTFDPENGIVYSSNAHNSVLSDVSVKSFTSDTDTVLSNEERTRIDEIAARVNQDLCRTFPSSDFFKLQGNLSRLGNVIVCYAALSKDVGYCQGMNFLAGLLLQLSDDEEETFWMLTLVMVRYNLQSLYAKEIPLLHLLKYQFEHLLAEHLPQVESHLIHHFVLPELYAVKWFLSLFAYSFPSQVVHRLWDFIFAACPPQQLHTGFSRAILLLALSIMICLKKKLLLAKSTRDILDVFEMSKLDDSMILKVARKLDSKILQANLEKFKSEWSYIYPTYRDAISRGELVALVTPAAILEWEGLKSRRSSFRP